MSSTRPIHSALPALDRAPVWLNSEPLTADGLRGRVVARRLLDVLVRQLAAHAAVRQGLARALSRPRARRRRRARARVRLRARPRQRAPRDRASSASATRSSSTTTSRSGGRSTTTTGRRSTSSTATGRVRFQHFGEGAYEETERAIQQLLGVDEELVRVDAGGLAEAADWDALRSPETYLGSARGERRSDRRADGLALNEWALAGEWTVGRGGRRARGGRAARSPTASRRRDLNLVLAPPASGAPVRFAVRLDGRAARRRPRARRRRVGRGHRRPSRGCTSSSASAAPSPSAPSRSRSSTRACARTSSRSAGSDSRSAVDDQVVGLEREPAARAPCRPSTAAGSPTAPGRGSRRRRRSARRRTRPARASGRGASSCCSHSVGLNGCAPLVDRDRVERVAHVAAERRVVERPQPAQQRRAEAVDRDARARRRCPRRRRTRRRCRRRE